jgi:hypothetical protein
MGTGNFLERWISRKNVVVKKTQHTIASFRCVRSNEQWNRLNPPWRTSWNGLWHELCT